ncbi:MAG: SRPBCC family protein [Bacteroidetes bacterium]|nr:SRPBCC family protein [Bacteroidota bacterium]
MTNSIHGKNATAVHGQAGNDQGTSDREIVISRFINAPRVSVFRAWTDPDHIGQWWGPRGFTTTTHAMDVRPGGIWRFTMHGPDGVDWGNRIDYIEVVEPERLVYMHGSDGSDDQPPFHVTVTFVEEETGTRLTMRSLFVNPAERERVVAFGAVQGGNQTLDRLEEYLVADMM